MMGTPTDDLIIKAMGARSHGIMTYVIRNILEMEHGFKTLKTATVLRRLKRLESAGRVRRVSSNYAVHHCWSVVETPCPFSNRGAR